MRLDIFISQQFHEISSREAAKKLIKKQQVSVNGKIVTKPAFDITPNDQVRILSTPKYVSRGGEKLEAAIRHFHIPVKGKTAIDIGASTGGFTDCLLQHSVKKVYGIDVGTAQLHPKLKNHPQVENYEHINARYLTQYVKSGQIVLNPTPNLLVMDVSFISVTKIITEAQKVMQPSSNEYIVLIKPQFEMDEKLPLKKGIIKSDELHRKAIDKIRHYLQKHQFRIHGIIPSPITGGDGNKEFLVYFGD